MSHTLSHPPRMGIAPRGGPLWSMQPATVQPAAAGMCNPGTAALAMGRVVTDRTPVARHGSHATRKHPSLAPAIGCRNGPNTH